MKQIQSSFELNKWIMACSKATNMRKFFNTLDNVNRNRETITQMIRMHQGEYASGIITESEFKDFIRQADLGLSDQSLSELTQFAIKGSERNRPLGEKDDMKT